MSQLVQLPPLRQSHVETAACPRAYVEIVINGKTQPDSIPSERGSDIHRVMAEYVKHCASKRIPADWEHFDTLSAASGPVAGPILDSIRDRYEVDWRHVYRTEVTLMLDEHFNPRNTPFHQGFPVSEQPVAYTGTLDVILISEDGQRAKINDYKSHPAPFDADTFQATLYAFMLFKHMPQIQTVTFELDFVRYFNCLRSSQFQRTDMPEMQAEISRARARQRATHERPEEALALPCKTCTYCPLAKTRTCPIADWNEYTTVSPPDRLMWREWMRRMNAVNNPVLKAFAEVHGPVSYTDGNGKRYEYASLEVPSTRYPLERTTIQLLEEHKQATGEDLLDGRLNVSSVKLKGFLKAKKRTPLREAFEESVIETSTKPKFAVRTPDEGIVEDFNPYEQED